MNTTKFAVTEALLSGAASAESVDEIAFLLTGGPGNRTAYMANAAKRCAARLVPLASFDRVAPALRMTDANYPVDCGSRFD